MLIEKASIADIPKLVDLLAVLFTQETEFTPDAQFQTKGLTRIINQPEIGTVLLARQNGDVVGMVILLFTVSTALGERVAWLEDMVVAPASRGSGLGKLLLSEAIAYARVQACKRITLLADQENNTAQRFYAQHGFTHSSMVPMRLSLEGN